MIPGLSFLLGLGVTLFAAVTRFARLTVPKSLIPLDEFYYPVNALGLLRHGSDFQLAKDAALPGVCSQIAIEPAFAVHPPVGKWLIGAGMRLFGCNALGWRVAAALFGTLAVLLVYLIGRRLFRSPWVAALGAMLLALDGLFFVQSRIAMLDIFLAFFIVLAIWLLTEDRARTLPGPTGIRWWRIGAAIAIGLAVATKWSALFLLPFLLIVALIWELDRRRRGRVMAAEFAAASMGLQPADGSLSWEPRELDPNQPEQAPPDDAPPEAPPEEPSYEDVPYEDAPYEDAPYADAPYRQTSTADDQLIWRIDIAREGAPPPPWDQAAEPLPAAAAAPLPPPPPPPRGFGPELLKIAAIFALIPLLVYIVAYLPWFFGSGTRYKPPRCATQNKIAFDGTISPVNSRIWNADFWPDQWQEFVCYQREIWDFHKNLKTIKEDGKPSHPYLSRAWSWPWMGRPASHYFDTRGYDPPCEQPATNAARVRAAQISQATPGASTTGGQTITTPPASPGTLTPSPVTSVQPADPTRECKTQAEILGLPNPGLWFPAFFLALPFAFYRAIFRRDQVAALLVLLFVPLYLPWLVTTRPLFLFYMTPAIPILALLVAHMADRVTDEMKPWQQTVAFALMMMLPFTPLFIQLFSTGRPAHLLYKIPLMGVIFLVLNGVATLLAYTPKPRRLMLVYGGLVLALFAYFYPVLAAVHIPDGGVFGWRNHMWVKRDCGREGILLNCWI